MTDHSTATGKPRPPWRAGALALNRLSDPVDARILVALRDRALGLQELRRSVGAPPPTTLRKHLAQLEADELLGRRRIDAFPGVGEVGLADAGHALLSVADSLSAWLGRCPDGPSGLGTSTARAAINALGAGWSSLMIRALAQRTALPDPVGPPDRRPELSVARASPRFLAGHRSRPAVCGARTRHSLRADRLATGSNRPVASRRALGALLPRGRIATATTRHRGRPALECAPGPSREAGHGAVSDLGGDR